jgi:hypothetical protein
MKNETIGWATDRVYYRRFWRFYWQEKKTDRPPSGAVRLCGRLCFGLKKPDLSGTFSETVLPRHED